MSKQTINIGASPNDGTGTPLRTSFDYTNQNFTEIYTALGGGVALPGATTQVIFNDGGTNLAGDAGLVYNKTTDALTVAGLVTAGSATITGDLTVDTSTLKVDSTNNRVIVGHTSGSAAFQVTNAGAAGLEIQPTGFSSSPLIQSYNRSGSAYTQLTLDASTIVHALSGTTAMTLNSTGNLVFPTGKGIDFSATSSGSGTMTSELLNDYEEGTWTIGLEFGGGNTGLTTSANTGRYTKVGRQVTVSGYIEMTNKGSSSGAAVINGLPFQISNQNSAYSAASLRLAKISYTGAFQAFGAVNGTTIGLEQISTLGAVLSLTDVNFANNSEIIFALTYTV